MDYIVDAHMCSVNLQDERCI